MNAPQSSEDTIGDRLWLGIVALLGAPGIAFLLVQCLVAVLRPRLLYPLHFWYALSDGVTLAAGTTVLMTPLCVLMAIGGMRRRTGRVRLVGLSLALAAVWGTLWNWGIVVVPFLVQ